jgi:hypothetical protein
MVRRGVFPILSERPLDESETGSAASAKVYVVERGAYSDRYIDAIFTTLELAKAYIENSQRRAFDRDGRKASRRVTGWKFTSASGYVVFGREQDGSVTVNGQDAEAAGYEDVPAETFEEFVIRHTWNEFGDVEEYDLWDVLPVIT